MYETIASIGVTLLVGASLIAGCLWLASYIDETRPPYDRCVQSYLPPSILSGVITPEEYEKIKVYCKNGGVPLGG